ncbi:MAG: DnaJ domain-containing protein [Aphanocapsa sp. GSE-SYN-MK-11-07L]|jgi:curved DNA-binding protein CbpA|nr:DnaJ domain-containing protein [Aphanocapsa sp. GSE-SYN-MK-11-07L]
MFLPVNQGLAKFDFTDYYAILGVPIGSSASDIRKRYLKIAKNLHPDSRDDENNRQLASQLLSKLVNPAYEIFSQDKQRSEYELLLRYVGQRVMADKNSITVESEAAQALNQVSNYEEAYQTSVKQLAVKQYEVLEQVSEVTGQLSELNLVYLLRREGNAAPVAEPPARNFATSASATSSTAVTPSPPVASPSPIANPTSSARADQRTTPPIAADKGTTPPDTSAETIASYVNQYCRRAEEFVAKGSYPNAIRELRDALKLAPQSSRCNSLLGTIYLKQNQLTMAKVHFNQALKINPQDGVALDGREKVTKLEERQQKAKSAAPAKPENRGLFGLFKGKK